jgi:hypothetical protein
MVAATIGCINGALTDGNGKKMDDIFQDVRQKTHFGSESRRTLTGLDRSAVVTKHESP